MPTFSSYNALGTTIEAGEITAGAVTHDKLGVDVNAWELLETLNFASATTHTTGSLKVCSEYMIIGQLDNTTSTATNINLRVNAINSGYYVKYMEGTSIIQTSGQTNIRLMIAGVTVYDTIFQVLLSGKSRPIAGGHIAIAIMGGGKHGMNGISGSLIMGNNIQVDNLTIYSGQVMTGNVRIYGR